MLMTLNLDHVIDVFEHVPGLINYAVLSRGFGVRRTLHNAV